MKWFNPIPATLEELKQQYRRLALRNHPDLGGNTADMQQINDEYAVLFERLKNTHRAASGETYTAKEETGEKANDFIDIINALINLDGLIIEICGKWLWISGNTKPHRAKLKELHFRWSQNKMAWYFHYEPTAKRAAKVCHLTKSGTYTDQKQSRAKRKQHTIRILRFSRNTLYNMLAYRHDGGRRNNNE